MPDRTTYPITITAEHEDVGCTIATTIYVGDREIARYRPGTRHVEIAQVVVEQAMANAMMRLIAPELLSDGYLWGFEDLLKTGRDDG